MTSLRKRQSPESTPVSMTVLEDHGIISYQTRPEVEPHGSVSCAVSTKLINLLNASSSPIGERPSVFSVLAISAWGVHRRAGRCGMPCS